MNILYDELHRPRAFWRIAFFAALFVAASVAAVPFVVAMGISRAPADSWASLFGDRVISLVVVAIATAVSARATEGRSFADVGYGLRPGWWRNASVGFALGAAAVAVAVLPAAVAGWLEGDARLPSASLALWLALLTVAAAFEELLCRGFAFQALVRGVGPVTATLVTSAFFAWLHRDNPNLTDPTVAAIAIANTFAAGVMLSVAYLRTRSLWLATGIHVGWNFAMGPLFGLPVSGIGIFARDAIVRTAETGPDAATGGAYGPEGGLLALVAIFAATAAIAMLPAASPRGDVTRA